jgi:hypothetical protein
MKLIIHYINSIDRFLRELLLYASIVVHLCLADTGNKIPQSSVKIFLLYKDMDVLWRSHLSKIVLRSDWIRVMRIYRSRIEFGLTRKSDYWKLFKGRDIMPTDLGINLFSLSRHGLQ